MRLFIILLHSLCFWYQFGIVINRIVIVQDAMIKVYTFTQNPQQLHVFETSPNPMGTQTFCCFYSFDSSSWQM